MTTERDRMAANVEAARLARAAAQQCAREGRWGMYLAYLAMVDRCEQYLQASRRGLS